MLLRFVSATIALSAFSSDPAPEVDRRNEVVMKEIPPDSQKTQGPFCRAFEMGVA